MEHNREHHGVQDKGYMGEQVSLRNSSCVEDKDEGAEKKRKGKGTHLWITPRISHGA